MQVHTVPCTRRALACNVSGLSCLQLTWSCVCVCVFLEDAPCGVGSAVNQKDITCLEGPRRFQSECGLHLDASALMCHG